LLKCRRCFPSPPPLFLCFCRAPPFSCEEGQTSPFSFSSSILTVKHALHLLFLGEVFFSELLFSSVFLLLPTTPRFQFISLPLYVAEKFKLLFRPRLPSFFQVYSFPFLLFTCGGIYVLFSILLASAPRNNK